MVHVVYLSLVCGACVVLVFGMRCMGCACLWHEVYVLCACVVLIVVRGVCIVHFDGKVFLSWQCPRVIHHLDVFVHTMCTSVH